MDLVQLDTGRKAIVKELRGGQQFIRKLEAMGIMPGSSIIKKSASLMKGPVVLQKGLMQMAIGYGMAKRIIVEPAGR